MCVCRGIEALQGDVDSTGGELQSAEHQTRVLQEQLAQQTASAERDRTALLEYVEELMEKIKSYEQRIKTLSDAAKQAMVQVRREQWN